jgi:RimJ/RimL family protein N-acetyltransferase
MPTEEDEEGSEFASVMMTPRLVLRAPSREDRAAMEALAANPLVADNLASEACPQPDAGGEAFAVVERRGRAVVGGASYGAMGDRWSARVVSAWIGQPYWGRGFATEAVHAVIDRAFADERVAILWCSNRASNQRARRVIEKCGFQFRETGMVRSSLRGAMPVERFVLERRNWSSLKSWGADNADKEDRHAPHDNAA